MNKKLIGILLGVILLGSLVYFLLPEDALPKPPAYLKLEYPVQEYDPWQGSCYELNINTNSIAKITGNCDVQLQYPNMKATIYLSYKPIQGNLPVLLRDAQKLTYEHVIKADEISERLYINEKRKVYGMFYDVGGNAASNTQFYVTDSVKHFVTGSVYFYAKPNFDSLLPASDYIKKDMLKIMESLEWRN